MLYYLFDWLDSSFDFPGAGVFQYISFRAACAVITSLLITIVFGKKLINFLRKKQVGETVRDLGLEGQKAKEGTPTMGGLIILAAILIPTLLFAKLDNIYVIIMLITTIWLGALGFVDDYIKVFKKNKAGLSGKLKVVGQVVLGIVVGCMMYFHPDITIKEKTEIAQYSQQHNLQDKSQYEQAKVEFQQESSRSTKTTIPFVKNNEFDYSWLIKWAGDNYKDYAWIIFIPIVIFFITAISNGANLTDGIDGLATGTSAIIGSCLAILAWVSGNIIFANYLNIMYIPNVGELTIFIAAFVGATMGFLWYNTHPAQIFMGDTGSLAIGGIIAVFAILIRKELLIPILCGVFIVENLSVVMQVSYFKFTKKKYGEGRRIFLMSPLHHHYQKKGYPEQKIVQRFFIVSIILAVTTIVTLKLR
ncbi:MAG: phospho-N-acetylmuramoyl-pentapeptide-transferase [Bacteroidales bacterium]|jgi:phospho-N-acetylmuramoyl-pentapeptide-transferase|nr:phospho-N-acetylmuramoyl-pentapeptide-transferase [Bacteroidales bacterium]MED9961871.1 phospho-N-acetylmuramoyl-pentapeptide-transferase [Bacteroidales bacterium]MEE0883094.1 phospho-N-acetylmuramoyl-pentapeptide-transferase [Bacteroidales bacterium]MEE1020304.1 phospho-N-acetylmuramoyl-pentapeptide-transferase [Bacteroidales bacterium]MEE1220631.1 phospho-N-acetylmuramoyl-pentapeptide-transferase [Bacteroidales bacterium]